MSTYAIGDLQGCYDELRALLELIRFDPARDQLWFTGDLVSRGPKSVECLRFVRQLGETAVTVLGNHDLHLLALHAQVRDGKRPDASLAPVLAAKDAAELMDWLRHRPLLHHDAALGFTLVHAGLASQWTLPQAQACAREVEAALRGPGYLAVLAKMYGDKPRRWSPQLAGIQRLRFSVNVFTRLRYCTAEGALALEYKGPLGGEPKGLVPWFAVSGRKSAGENIVFGHWSALGRTHWPEYGVYGIDSGCVWGGALTALRLEDLKVFNLPCKGQKTAGD